jgi:hypothetical protein
VLRAATYAWWSRIESQALGTAEFPRKAVVEPELEVNENQRNYYAPQGGETPSRLPFVRVFSLETKCYVYADVDDVKGYEFDTTALARLHLPAEMLSILTRVFNTPIEQMFGDLIQGKHGGLVILACGKPGVGKTLTAEVYAETTERPPTSPWSRRTCSASSRASPAGTRCCSSTNAKSSSPSAARTWSVPRSSASSCACSITTAASSF